MHPGLLFVWEAQYMAAYKKEVMCTRQLYMNLRKQTMQQTHVEYEDIKVFSSVYFANNQESYAVKN